MGLDPRGGGLIPVHDALMLMQTTHGDAFSLSTWNSFLASRGPERATTDVYFDEIRLWLCNLPSKNKHSSDKDVAQEKNKLDKQLKQNDLDNLNSHKAQMDAENETAKKQVEYEENTKRMAQRKKNM